MKNIRLLYILSITLFLFGTVSFLSAQAGEESRMIRIETSLGEMVVKLYNQTPGHRDNMIKLIEEGFYEKHLFHRIIRDFMIQGGDPESVDASPGQRLGNGGPGYTIPAEFSPELFHKKGAMAAARMGDRTNPEKASSGSQFYLVQGRTFTPEMLTMMETERGLSFSPQAIEAYTTVGGTPHLDGSYTVFGEVVEGLEVLDLIAAQATDANDRPLENVVFSISLIK